MTKDEFEKKIESEKPYLGARNIIINKFLPGSYILGCYFNEHDNKWNVYQTGERGNIEVLQEAGSEEDAYEKLYNLIMFYNKIYLKKNNT